MMWQEAQVVVADQKPKIELKDFPGHLEYAFFEEDQQKPAIIVVDLAKHEKC